MRKLLMIAFMLLGLIVQAQEMYLKTYLVEVSGDTVTYGEVSYDENWMLTKIDYGELSYIYSNDTLVKVDVNGGIFTFTYYQDSVIERYPDGTLARIYYYNENRRIDSIRSYNFEGYNRSAIYTWDDAGDCTSLTYTDNGYTVDYNYYEEYVYNPFYKSEKNLPTGVYGSIYYVTDLTINDNYWYDVIVEEELNDYPIRSIKVDENGFVESTSYYTYEVISNVGEIFTEPYTVLSVDYYDLMGRKIPKPSQGFYIERKTTDKGVISTKYFIQ